VSRCGGRIPSRFRLGNGMKIRGFLGDMVCYHIAVNGWYEPEMIEAVRRSLTPKTVFFDVGAHIGQYSLMAAQLCREVHAFEAHHPTAEALRHNVTSNGLANVTVNGCAVCDHLGTATFHESSADNPGASSLYGEGRSVEVGTITLDSYCANLALDNKPIVLKIDVEGAELSVLRGAENLLARGNVIIFAELIDSLQRRAGSSCDEVLVYLQKHGYSMNWFDDKNIVVTTMPSLIQFRAGQRQQQQSHTLREVG
jgi:FkbM family methyltransferase